MGQVDVYSGMLPLFFEKVVYDPAPVRKDNLESHDYGISEGLVVGEVIARILHEVHAQSEV